MTAREIVVLNEDLPRLEALQPGDTYILLEDMDITGGITSVDYVQFDLSYTDGQYEGRLQWNDDLGTLEYGLPGDNINLHVGQEMIIRVRNNSGAPIPSGSVVYISGSHSANRPEITLAQANGIPQALAAGIAQELIPNSSQGYIATFGTVHDINTLGFTEGAPIFLSTTVAGGYQQDRPITGSAYAVFIGYVIKAHATEGSIAAHINIIPRLDRLSGVKYDNPEDGEALKYIAANNQYEFYYVVDVSVDNINNVLYVEGDESTDGSIRFTNDTESEAVMVERRESGVWQPYSLEAAPATLWVGHNVGIGGVGHHLVTKSTELGSEHLHFHAHSEFEDGISQADTAIVNAYAYYPYVPIQPDDSVDWVGTLFELVQTPGGMGIDTLLDTMYLKTGSVSATAPVRMRVWEGTDDTGRIMYDHTYATDMFPAENTITAVMSGYLEFMQNTSYFFRYESAENFSFKTNAAGTFPWTALTFSAIRENQLLQTNPYEDGQSYALGQLLITDRQIYKCLVDGVQTGTWEQNSAKWSKLGSETHAEEIAQDTFEIHMDRVITTELGVVTNGEGNIILANE